MRPATLALGLLLLLVVGDTGRGRRDVEGVESHKKKCVNPPTTEPASTPSADTLPTKKEMTPR